ncbi:MAG: hypothetical protein M3Z31_07065, partial [Pseudomonadota bacterium]|nr:hypothetical protein [Pseudomonadota bacterium]
VHINKATQTIGIAGLSSPPACGSPVKTYGQPGFVVGVTGGGSGESVTFTSSDNCSVTTSPTGVTSVQIGGVGTGTCSITAKQAGNVFYTAATPLTQCFTVNKAGQTVDNFVTIPTKTFGLDGPFPVSPNPMTSPAGLPVTLSSSGKCTLSSVTPPATVTLTGSGICTITAAAPGNANYQAVAPAQSFQILGTPQTVDFVQPADRALGSAAFALAASATSNLPVTFTVQGTTACTLSQDGRTLKLVAPGVCTVTASQSGTGSNYAAADNVVRSFKVYLSGLAGLTSLTIGSDNALVDSFDSSVTGGYAATKSAKVNVLSNGTINVQGDVGGNVQSVTANVVLSSQTLVTGNVTAGTTISNAGIVQGTMAPNQPLPAIVAPAVVACSPFTPAIPSGWISGNYSYNATKGDLTVSGQNTVTLASGTYCLNSITLSGGAKLAANGPVKINLTGPFSATGNSVANPGGIPRSLQIATSYTGNNGFTMSGNAAGYLTVYAPGASVTLSGNAELFGAVIAKSYTGSGNHQMHYDVKTLDVWGAIFGL